MIHSRLKLPSIAILGLWLLWPAVDQAAQESKTTADLVKNGLESSNIDRQRAALVLIPELGLKGAAATATARQIDQYLRRTSDPESKALALAAYGKLSPPAAPAAEVVKTYLADPSPRVRQAAGQALVDLIAAAVGDFGKPVVTIVGTPGAVGIVGGSAPSVAWTRTWIRTMKKEERAWPRLYEDAKNLLPYCATALRDPDDVVKESGAEGIRLFARAIADTLPDPGTSIANTKVIDPYEAKLKWLLLQPTFAVLNENVPPLTEGLSSSRLETRKAATLAAEAVTQVRALALASRRYPPEDIDTLVETVPPEDVLKNGTTIVLPALAGRLDDPSREIRLIAIEGFEHQGAESRPYLDAIIHASKNSDLFVRWVATRTLGRLFAGASTAESKRIVKALEERILDVDIDVRATALTAIGKAGAAGRSATAAVLALASRGDPGQRVLAMTTLPLIDADRAETLPVMAQALSSPQSSVRKAAVTYLGSLGADARPVLADLRPLLSDPDEDVRKETARALLAIE